MKDYSKRIIKAVELDDEVKTSAEFVEILSLMGCELAVFIGSVSPMQGVFLAAIFRRFMQVLEERWPGCIDASEELDDIAKLVFESLTCQEADNAE